MTKDELIQIVQNETGVPWFNGRAFVDAHGFAVACRTAIAATVDLEQVMQDLRKKGDYEASDQIRAIVTYLKRDAQFALNAIGGK